MLAHDGIVVAADAQESDQYYKRSQQKIFTLQHAGMGNNQVPPSYAFAITGAGEAGYVDAYISFVLRDLPGTTHKEFEDALRTKTLQFYQDNIFPLAAARQPPEIQMLIGASLQGHALMFASYGSTIRRSLPHAAVGIGAHFALSLIDELNDIWDIKRTELVAAYIISATKDRIEGCGKITDIVSLRNWNPEKGPDGKLRLVPPDPLLMRVPQQKIERWEESFKTRWAPRQAQLFTTMLEEEVGTDCPPSDPQK